MPLHGCMVTVLIQKMGKHSITPMYFIMLKKPSRTTKKAAGARFAIVASRYNRRYVDSMLKAARKELEESGASEVKVVRVPGAFEIPLAAQAVAEKGDVDAIIALGAVIRGSTPHFDYVAGESASGLNKVQMDTGVPCSFGVLTVDTIEQAIERAGTKSGNKGAEASLVAIEMVSVLRQISE